MPEVPLTSLDPRLQKQVESARTALERGNFDYTVEICSQILRTQPGVLPIRKLMRAAQIRKFNSKNKLFAKAFGSFSSAPFMISGASAKKDPQKALETAEKMLAGDPTSMPGNKLLAEAAAALDLPETAAFALETVAEQSPSNRDLQLQLGEAYIAAGRHKDALQVADKLLKKNPVDGDAQTLMRRASVAQTVKVGNWGAEGDFRAKLKDEEQAVSLEQSAKVMTSSDMTQRLIDEAVERLKSDPENLNHYRAIVQGYRAMEKPAEALEWIRRARALPAGGGDTALERTEFELASAVLQLKAEAAEAAAAAAPADAALRAAADAAQTELKEFQLKEAELFVERYPNDHEAQFRLGALYLDLGEVDKAAGRFQMAQRGPKVRIQSLAGLGKCFRAKKLYDLAAQQFRAAKGELGAMDDVKKDVIYQLATALEEMGKREDAIAEFKLIYSEDIGYRDVAEKINKFYGA